MPAFNTSVVDVVHEVDQRLADWGLTRDQFLAIGKAAKAWSDDASPLMPQNAPGTLAYIFGVQELRRQLVDTDWRVDRTSGIEAVVNHSLGLRIGFHNVDASCDPAFPPHPRSSKGSASESCSGPDLFQYFGIEPGPVNAARDDGIATYYVMVGEDGSVELSSPIILDGTYRHFRERIFIFRPTEDWESGIGSDNGPVEDFDIEISFKDQI